MIYAFGTIVDKVSLSLLILYKSLVIPYFSCTNSIQIKSITRVYTQLFMYITAETGMDDKEYPVYLANRRLKLAPVVWHVLSPQESLKGGVEG